jgi:hypothetical protein
MLKSILGGVAIITLLPITLTALSLNYRQESNSPPSLGRSGCLELPEYDAKAGFPLPFLYDTAWYHTSSPVGIHRAAAGGPFALIYFDDSDSFDCNHFNMVAFWLDLAFYTVISVVGVRAIKAGRFFTSR